MVKKICNNFTMYFNKKNDFYHGIMLHHFHDRKRHIKSQGSINASQFEKLLKLIGQENFLTPEEFMHKCLNKTIKKKELCLTFDDSLKCQLDIALPVMKKLNLKSFFFISSSILTSKPDNLELYRYFRHKYFKKIDIFYENFFNTLRDAKTKIDLEGFFKKEKKTIHYFKIKHPMYSKNDILFRLVRDRLLNKKQYDKIMYRMFEEKKFNYKKQLKNLYLNKEDIKKIDKSGHMIGLHSHTHPNMMEKLNYQKQFREYNLNKIFLENLLDKKILSMSHPCGSYNLKTLNILKKIGIKIGFKQTMQKDRNMKKINNSLYEIARANHSQIIKNHNIN